MVDVTIVGVAIAVLCCVLAALLFLKSKRAADNSDSGGRRRAAVPTIGEDGQVVGRRPAPARPGGRRGGPRMRRAAAEAANNEDVANEDDNDAGGSEGDDPSSASVKAPGKIGKKKLEKLQAKAEKKREREAAELEREEAKKRKEAEDEIARKEAEQQKLEEERRAEEEKKRREERERRDYEEYLKLKATFDVEEEGYEEDSTEGDSLLQAFVDYVKETKVVLLEDLAAHFKMKTQDAIDRVNALNKDGTLTGVLDDRGKFIYISQEELNSVAKFIKQRGRVSIAELAENSNQLITLSGS